MTEQEELVEYRRDNVKTLLQRALGYVNVNNWKMVRYQITSISDLLDKGVELEENQTVQTGDSNV